VSIHERGFDATTGAKIFGGATPDVLNRTRAARLFTGYVAIEFKPGVYGLMSNVSIWDAGQIVPVVTDKGEKTKFAVELAYCTYPNGDHVLKIAIHEQGFTNDGLIVPVAYAWSQQDATQVGINLRYIQAGLELAKPSKPPVRPPAKFLAKPHQVLSSSLQSPNQCTDCLKCPEICGSGLKCETGDSGGVCTKCTGQYETPCGYRCCLSGQECHQGSWGASCTTP